MARVAAIGSAVAVQGFGLAGAVVRIVDDGASALSAWRDLPDDVAVVVLSADAAAALPDEVFDQDWPLIAVLP